MKFLKYLLALILLLVVIFFALGFFTPSVSYDCEVTVDQPAKVAWAVMSDETKVADWIKGYKRSELVSGTPNTVGAVTNMYVEEAGEEMMMTETITALVPMKQMSMDFTMDFMDMEYDMQLEEKDGKTVIKTKSTTVGNGMLAKSIVSLMPSAMKAQEEENLKNLKKLIEENTKNYFPEPVEEMKEE